MGLVETKDELSLKRPTLVAVASGLSPKSDHHQISPCNTNAL